MRKKLRKVIEINALLLLWGLQHHSYADVIMPEDMVVPATFSFGFLCALIAIVLAFSLLIMKLSNNKKQSVSTNVNNSKRALFLFGSILSFCWFVFWIANAEIIGIGFLFTFLMFIIAMRKRIKPKTSNILGIASIIIVILIPLFFGIPDVSQAPTFEEKKQIFAQSTDIHNDIFESYFGKNLTATEVSHLLGEIRTNNLQMENNNQENYVYICFVSKNTTANESAGIYASDLDPLIIDKNTFNNYTFSKDVLPIKEQIKPESSYTVDVPNYKRVVEKKWLWRRNNTFNKKC